MQTLDDIMQTFRATGQLTWLIPLDDELQIYPLAGKGDVYILAGTTDLTACLAMLESFADPETNSSFLESAQKLTVLGLNYKNHGNLSDAYLCYRIALSIAFHRKVEEGVEAITTNIWALLQQVTDLTVRGNELSPHITDETFSTQARKEYTAALNGDPVALKTVKAKLEQTKELIRADAVVLLQLLGLGNKEPAAPMTLSDLMLTAAWNLSVAAGYVTLRKGLTQERLTSYEKKIADKNAKPVAENAKPAAENPKSATENAKPDNPKAYWLILQELAVIDAGEFLIGEPFQGQQVSYFNYIWSKYTALTKNIKELVYSNPIVSLYESAFRQLEYISFKLTSAGGAIGHLLNYNFSGFFQTIGRDYIAYTLVQRPNEKIKAYELAEQIRNRSMINWIGRTVYHSRIPKQACFPLITTFIGSVNAIEPIQASEMGLIPAVTGASVISYLLTPVGLIIWLQTTAGELYSYVADWGKIKQLLSGYLQAAGTHATLPPPDTHFFNNTMSDLYLELFPIQLREKLDQPGTSLDQPGAKLDGPGAKKIIFVTDQELDYLPFCALLTPSNEYLTEKYEISYLPSLTAFYIHEKDTATGVPSGVQPEVQSGLPSGVQPSLPAWQPPLLMGLSDFTELRVKTGLPFRNLEGTKEELMSLSALLNTPYLLDSAATYDNLYRQGIHCRIMHIASHAWFDMANPSESFFVLYDTIVKASEVYRFDRGFRNGLVVLSACQTGLGKVAPDAGFSLANAFIVAGAKSVISALWQVPDKATRQLMERLYTGLSQGLSIPLALQQAQLSLIANKEYAHPIHWAGFKLVGLHKNPSGYA